ncbi:MAG: hypothetical protein ABDI07_08805 [Candidatus Kryptonium sp.]
MKTIKIILSLIMSILLLLCQTPEPNIIESLRFEPPLFDPFKQNTKIKYNLLKPATVSIYIYDREGRKIKTIAENLNLTAGNQSHGWKGDNDQGEFQTAGIYIGAVAVKGNKTYKTTVEIFYW